MSKKAVVEQFEVLAWNLHGRTEGDHDKCWSG